MNRLSRYIISYPSQSPTRILSSTFTRHKATMASHPLLQAFKASKPAFGVWLTLPSTWAARSVAQASPHLSWVVIDCEHGLTPLQPGAADSIVAVSGLGQNAPSVLVRIPATGASADGSAGWQIKYVLDAGARGVIVPMVSSPLDFIRLGSLLSNHDA